MNCKFLSIEYDALLNLMKMIFKMMLLVNFDILAYKYV